MSEPMPLTFQFGKTASANATTKAKKPRKAMKHKEKEKQKEKETKRRSVPVEKRVIPKHASEAAKITKSFGDPLFYILPKTKLPPGLLGELYQIPNGPKAQKRWLTDYIQRYANEKKKESAAGKQAFSFKLSHPLPPSYFWTLPPISLVREHFEKARHVRQALSRLVHIWRVHHLKAVNTEDIVTMDVPLKPVHVVDWAQKTTTIFEANTLMRDITTCLLHHDGFFEEPKAPRNPLTNLPLTQSQILSVWMQITKSGIPTSAVFAQFRQARYCLQNFHIIYGVPLRLHAFRDTMKNLLAYDSKECLFNFIDLASTINRKSYSLTKLMRDLRSEDPQHVCYFSKWRQRCMEHHEASFLYTNQPDVMKKIQHQSLLKTRILLENKEYFQSYVPSQDQQQEQQQQDQDQDEESDSETETETETEEDTSPLSSHPLVEVTASSDEILLPLLSSMTTSQISNLLFPLQVPSSTLLRVPVLPLSMPEPPPSADAVRALYVAAAQNASQTPQAQEQQQQQDTDAMTVFLNLLLDMGETNLSDFLPN